MKVSLVVAEGQNRGRSIQLREPVFVIGRDPECQIRASSDSISRKHCEILVGDEDVLIRDLGSTNGTFVNGEHLRDAVEVLRNGDHIEVGPLQFIVRIVAPVPKPSDDPTKLMAADPTAVEGMPQPSEPANAPVTLTEDGDGEISDAPTRLGVPIPENQNGPPTATQPRTKQPPPPTEEGVSKVASELIRKMFLKSGKRPPSGPGHVSPTR